MNTARFALGGAGTQTAGLGFGGYIISTGDKNSTEEYSSFSWSNGGNLGTARRSLSGCGTQTAGLAFGGFSALTATEEYGGTSWTGGGALSTGRRNSGGAGTSNSRTCIWRTDNNICCKH